MDDVHPTHREVIGMAGEDSGRPSIYPSLLYTDAKAAIRQLTEAFGFTELAVYEGEDGSVMHAELVQGNGAVMLGSKGRGGRFDEAMKSAGPAGCTSSWTTSTPITGGPWSTARRS